MPRQEAISLWGYTSTAANQLTDYPLKESINSAFHQCVYTLDLWTKYLLLVTQWRAYLLQTEHNQEMQSHYSLIYSGIMQATTGCGHALPNLTCLDPLIDMMKPCQRHWEDGRFIWGFLISQAAWQIDGWCWKKLDGYKKSEPKRSYCMSHYWQEKAWGEKQHCTFSESKLLLHSANSEELMTTQINHSE